MSLHWYKHAERPSYIIDGGYFLDGEYVAGYGNKDDAPDVISVKELVMKILGNPNPHTKLVELEMTEEEIVSMIEMWGSDRGVSIEQTDIDSAKADLADAKK